jgi:hypothetical protein
LSYGQGLGQALLARQANQAAGRQIDMLIAKLASALGALGDCPVWAAMRH